MNAFRSSPLRDLALASALHFFIFSCWVMGVAATRIVAPQVHCIVTVRARRQGTEAAMGEIEAVELFGGLGHGMVMVTGCG